MKSYRQSEEPDAVTVQRYYDAWTDRYLKSYGNILQSSRPTSDKKFLRYILDSAGIRRGMRLLDAGCGVCGPSIYFASKRSVRIDAVTISGVQADIARAAISQAGLDAWINVRRGDFHDLATDYPAASYDMVFFLESFGYSRSIPQVLSNVSQVLKPNGYVYIKDHFPVPQKDPTRREFQRQNLERMKMEYCYTMQSLAETVTCLTELGFWIEFIKKPAYLLDDARAVTFEQDNELTSLRDAIKSGFELYETLEIKFRKLA